MKRIRVFPGLLGVSLWLFILFGFLPIPLYGLTLWEHGLKVFAIIMPPFFGLGMYFYYAWWQKRMP